MPNAYVVGIALVLAAALLAWSLSSCIGAGRVTTVGPVGGPGRFPAVEGIDLTGELRAFPSDFEGRVNLAAVAFLRGQQAEVDTWIEVAGRLRERHPSLRFYEFPVIEPLNPIARFYINNGMRSGIPDADKRESTITFYVEKKAFREALNMPDENSIYVLLLGGSGNELWRARGPATPEAEAALAEAIGNHLENSSQAGQPALEHRLR